LGCASSIRIKTRYCFQAARPIPLNGIEDVISRSDLGDRAIFLTLPPIADHSRRPEKQFWDEFEIAGPCILGRRTTWDSSRDGRLSRATACETAFWPAGTFARAY
jgi:hypothetical protein